AGALRDVLKSAVVPVAVQADGGLSLSGNRVTLLRPVCAIDQQDVRPAVPIIIQEANASADGFRVPLVPGSSGSMGERYAGSSGHIRKPDCGGSNGNRRPRLSN